MVRDAPRRAGSLTRERFLKTSCSNASAEVGIRIVCDDGTVVTAVLGDILPVPQGAKERWRNIAPVTKF